MPKISGSNRIVEQFVSNTSHDRAATEVPAAEANTTLGEAQLTSTYGYAEVLQRQEPHAQLPTKNSSWQEGVTTQHDMQQYAKALCEQLLSNSSQDGAETELPAAQANTTTENSSWPEGVTTMDDMETYAKTLFGECIIENLLANTPFDNHPGCFLIRVKGACNKGDWNDWPKLIDDAMKDTV